MNKTEEVDQPYKGQKFASFEHLKKYLEEYGQKNYVNFWIRSSHTRNSQKSKISKTMNPDLKYVSIKFACIFGGEKIRYRGTGIRKSYTYRNLGCPCMINAVVGEDGNHVKLDTVILEHNHALCKTLYDSLKKTKRKSQLIKNDKELTEGTVATNTDLELIKDDKYLTQIENLAGEQEWLEENQDVLDNLKADGINLENVSQPNENCLKDIEDKCGKIVKILVINSESQSSQNKKEPGYDEFSIEALGPYQKGGKTKETPEICRLCLSSKGKLSPIFNPKLPLESTVLSFKIMGCASIEISSNDGLPNNICATCEANLDVAYNFRVKCEQSDSILRETYAKNKGVSCKKDSEKQLDDDNSNEGNSFQETVVLYSDDENQAESFRPAGDSTQDPVHLQFSITRPDCGTDLETYEKNLISSIREESGSQTDKEGFLLACNICTLVCPSMKDLQDHMRDHLKETKTETWRCGTCDATFQTAEDLKTHEISHEESETRTKKQISEVKYLCNVCGKIFKTKDRFQAHRNMHEGLRPHVCLQCGRGFADRKNLHQHYDVVHLRKVRHECPVCQRKFYTRTKMNSHMTMHSGDKPFTCDICNKTFRLKMNMYKHKKTHTNDRPYQCDKCNAAFIEKNLLKRHSYKHGGVRPFRCPVCGHGFSAKFYLKKHLKDSRCRGVVIADPESYQWMGMSEPEANLDDGKCVVVYKTQDGDALTEEAETIDLNILQEYKDEPNT